jgi:hypothetical protein
MTDTPLLLDLLSQQRVLSSHIEEEARKVLGDNERLRHALANLVNAIGPTPTISVDRADEIARAALGDTQP